MWKLRIIKMLVYFSKKKIKLKIAFRIFFDHYFKDAFWKNSVFVM